MDNNDEKNVVNVMEGVENVSNMQEQDVEQSTSPKKSKAGVFIAIVVALLILATGVFAYSKLSKPISTKFANLLTKDQKFLENVVEEMKYSQVNTELTIFTSEFMNSGGVSDDFGDIRIKSKVINKDDDATIIVEGSMDNLKKELLLEIVKDKNLLGLNVQGITEKFIGIDLDDEEGLIKNLEKEFDTNISQLDLDNTKIDEEQLEKVIKFVEKYVEIAAKELDGFIVKKANQEFTVLGKEEKATEYTLTINQESVLKVSLAVLKNLKKNSKDIDFIIELSGTGITREEIVKSLEDAIEEIEKLLKDGLEDDEDIALVKVYEKSGKNIATIIEAGDSKIIMYTFEDKNSTETYIGMQNDYTEMYLIINTEKEKSGSRTTIKLKDGKDQEIRIAEIKEEFLKKAEDDMIKLDRDDMLLLNTASKEEIESFVEKAIENAQRFVEGLMYY